MVASASRTVSLDCEDFNSFFETLGFFTASNNGSCGIGATSTGGRNTGSGGGGVGLGGSAGTPPSPPPVHGSCGGSHSPPSSDSRIGITSHRQFGCQGG